MAFDSIEWPYLFEVLARFGFGPQFQKWVALLYNEALEQVRGNNHTSRIFTLHRGTRQGCPLSPLLFALTLEPLVHWIRRDVVLRGQRWSEDIEDRISYADYILVYLASPSTSISRLFTNFGSYAINWSKSVLYVLHGPPPKLPTGYTLEIAHHGFKYLGIFDTPDSKLFYESNLLKPLKRLQEDVKHWRSLPLTLLGRAALSKMLALPRLQNSPYSIPVTSQPSKGNLVPYYGTAVHHVKPSRN